MNSNWFYCLGTVGHARSVHPANDDIIAVESDGGHRVDAAHAEDASEAGVKFAQEGPEVPNAAVERVVDKRWALDGHHEQIGERQVDNEVVVGRPQLLRLGEEVQDDAVPCQRRHTKES